MLCMLGTCGGHWGGLGRARRLGRRPGRGVQAPPPPGTSSRVAAGSDAALIAGLDAGVRARLSGLGRSGSRSGSRRGSGRGGQGSGGRGGGRGGQGSGGRGGGVGGGAGRRWLPPLLFALPFGLQHSCECLAERQGLKLLVGSAIVLVQINERVGAGPRRANGLVDALRVAGHCL
eukprot:scaffold46372_cov72-Phaeocystis_antarctica.AAC.1